MISIPKELFFKIMQTNGNLLAMSNIPKNKLNHLIEEILEDWELYNRESDLYKQCKDNIIFGYDAYKKFTNNFCGAN